MQALYVLRRCSACSAVSHVGAVLPSRTPWNCVWCKASNTGFRPRGDPAAATIGDLAGCVADRGLAFEPLEAEAGAAKVLDTTRVLIVTTDEIPG
jgi:hypothetical protein